MDQLFLVVNLILQSLQSQFQITTKTFWQMEILIAVFTQSVQITNNKDHSF